MPDLYATSGVVAMVDVVVQVVVFGSGVQVASEAATGGVALLDERRADCSVVEPSPSHQVGGSVNCK